LAIVRGIPQLIILYLLVIVVTGFIPQRRHARRAQTISHSPLS
jgi:hypothetical protein